MDARFTHFLLIDLTLALPQTWDPKFGKWSKCMKNYGKYHCCYYLVFPANLISVF
jgi:hypothetical protein